MKDYCRILSKRKLSTKLKTHLLAGKKAKLFSCGVFKMFGIPVPPSYWISNLVREKNAVYKKKPAEW